MLEGPNLYFPRAAIKLTLDIGGLASAPTATAERLARGSGCRARGPGSPTPGFRQRFALRAVAGWCGRSPHESGAPRLAVRVRPTPTRTSSWSPTRGGTATARRRWAGPSPSARRRARRRGRRGGRAGRPRGSRRAEAGAAPHTITPRVPVVAVTGTNGKTTTCRMIAHIGAGRRQARRLVEHRRHLPRRRAGGGGRLLRPERGRPGAGPAGRPARGHRDRARAASCSRASG